MDDVNKVLYKSSGGSVKIKTLTGLNIIADSAYVGKDKDIGPNNIYFYWSGGALNIALNQKDSTTVYWAIRRDGHIYFNGSKLV